MILLQIFGLYNIELSSSSHRPLILHHLIRLP